MPAIIDVAAVDVPAGSDGGGLSILNPAFGLAARLAGDRHITVRGSLRTRRAGVLLFVVGLLLVVSDRLLLKLADLDVAVRPRFMPLAVGLEGVGAVVAFVGALVLLAGFTFPARRRLVVRLGASQRQEWQSVQQEAKLIRLLPAIGLGMVAAGAALTYLLLGLPAPAFAVAGLLVLAAGLALLVYASARRTAVHRLYLQTLLLSNLERTGAGTGLGDDVGKVLVALDRLLGALPDAEVQAFLATPEAERYLVLMEKLRGGARE